jgi:hypothetical protein
VAVIQISKIQVRRGQKNSNSGIPQLSSAEFAWAVDTQELYIGNGSVLEGAPYVGNTQILTEHTDILSLISSYEFASNDPSIVGSVPRSLQTKLDEYVSVLDFGAAGDGSTDNVAAFETAFTQLFRNANDTFKKVLLVPNGTYLFSSDLRIPSNVIIQGENRDGAILNIGANNIRFITADGTELAGFSSTDRPQDVKVSNLTIQRTTGQTVLSGVADSKFVGVKFIGTYVLGNTVASLATAPAAVFWQNTLEGTKVDNIEFNECFFEANSISIKATQLQAFDTAVTIRNSKFFINHVGVYIEGIAGQLNKWQINDCEFEEIASQVFRSTNGQGTFIQRSKFKNCGNNTGTASSPTTYIVYFGEKTGNCILNCTSDRQQAAAIVSSNTVKSITEVYNGDHTSFVDRNHSAIFLSDSFRPVAVFSAFNKYMVVNYFLKLSSHSRVGQLWITVDDDLTSVAITDQYQYSPSLTTDPGGALMTNFEFIAELRDNDNAVSGIDTVVLSYKNPLATGATGSISFDVAYGV